MPFAWHFLAEFSLSSYADKEREYKLNPIVLTFEEQQGVTWQALCLGFLLFMSTSQFADIHFPGLQVAYLQPHYLYT